MIVGPLGLEEQHWGRDVAVAMCRTTLTLLAFNTAQVYRSRSGQRLSKKGIRRLRREVDRELGRAPAVVFLEDCYAVMSLEELLAAVGGRGPSRPAPRPRGANG